MALSPVDLLGCKTRGLVAAGIALLSGLPGIGPGIIAIKGKSKGEAGSGKWILTTLILTIPVAELLVLA